MSERSEVARVAMTSAATTRHGPRRRDAVAVALATGSLYFIVSRYVVAINDPVNDGAGFWPGAGVTVTALVLTRTSWWPGILAAVGVAELTNGIVSGFGTTASAAWAAANMVEPLLAAVLIRQFRAGSFSNVRDVGWFVTAAVVGPIAGGLIGAIGTRSGGSSFTYGDIVIRWIAGDALGILTVAPAGILLLQTLRGHRQLIRAEAGLVVAAVLATAIAIFYVTPDKLTGPYLLIPPLLWAALRFGVTGAAISTFLTAQLANHAHGLGHTILGTETSGPLPLQTYLATMTISMLVVGARTNESITHQQAAEAEKRTTAALAELADSTQQLQASEAKFRGLFEWATTGIVMADLEGRLLAANPAFCSMLGGTEEELVGARFIDLTLEDDRAESAALHASLVAGEVAAYRIEKRYPRDDGKVVHGHVAVSLVRDDRGNPLHTVATVEDITAQREAAAESVRLADQLATTVESISDALYTLDHDLRFTYVNSRAEEILQRDRSTLLGRAIWDEFPEAAETEAGQAYERALRDHVTEALDDFYSEPLDAWFDIRVYPSELGLAVYFQDVSERREFEEQMLRAQRMESIGTLAGGLSHDLNNILAPIVIATDVLEREDLDAAGRRMVEIIRSSAMRAGDMVGQILTFARGIEGDRVPVDVDGLLADVESITNDTFLKKIQVVRERSSGHGPVRGDPTQLHQVLLNLCVNARDAMPQGGTLRLSSESVVVDETTASRHEGVEPGPFVRILVEDEGTGIPPDLVHRVFEPFFTTKTVGHGTGLGLSTATGIVKSHGGFLEVASEVGVGTTFSVNLPTTPTESEPYAGRGVPELRSGAGELVLVVDDEEPIRAILRTVLEKHSYRVLEAADGLVAVELFVAHRDEVDLVLTDMMMPGIDGAATIKRLRAIRPDIPIVAASGLPVEEHHETPTDLAIQGFLSKPFTAEAVLAAIRTALTEPS